jgi:GNAT superfamily N-acetyltransferase
MMIDCSVARKEDLDQLVALLGILFSQEAELSPDPRRQRRALEAILGDPARATIYVAREAGRVIGMAALHYGISTAEGGKAAWLEDMCVLPEARGRGVGPGLLRYVLDDARRQAVLRVSLLTDADNHRAQGLYRKLGFRPSSMLAMRLHL